jgi:hypothetical protein
MAQPSATHCISKTGLYVDNLPVAEPDISSIIRFASAAIRSLRVDQVQDLMGGYQS